MRSPLIYPLRIHVPFKFNLSANIAIDLKYHKTVEYISLPNKILAEIDSFFKMIVVHTRNTILFTVFHEYLAGIIFSEFVILEISRVFNLAIPKNRAG